MKLWGFVALIVAVSCGWSLYALKQPPSETLERPNEPPIVWLPADDPALEEATERARSTIDTFLAALARGTNPPSQAQLKVRIEEGDVVEHVWLVDLTYERGMIYGSLGNEPAQLREWALGDPAMVAPNEITDWLLIDESGVQGGFTLRAACERISPDELEAFNAQFAAHFGVDPEGFFNDR